MQIARPRVRKDEERILPLVNVVFLLLIFFMIAGELAARDDIEITPPVSSSETPAGSRELLVQMPADGPIVLDGEVTEVGSLAGLLRQRREEVDGPLSLFLKADAALPADQLVAVLEEVRSAGLSSVRLLTLADFEQ